MEEILVSRMLHVHRLTLLRSLAWPFMKLSAALSWMDPKWEHFLPEKFRAQTSADSEYTCPKHVQSKDRHPENCALSP